MAKNITGIIGYPLSHTLSPVMHNNSFKHFKMDWEYKVFETTPDNLRSFVQRARALGIRGYNVTIPHKHAVMKSLDELDKAAAVIGAVNTVVNIKGLWRGYNTDYIGFMESLKKRKINLKNKKVVMFGAGGAAYAVAYAINSYKPALFNIYNIDIPMIKGLLTKLKLLKVKIGDIKKTPEKDAIIAAADFVINCTSVGMHDTNVVYQIDKLKKKCVVYDLIYNPSKTGFLKNAEKKGARIINGLDMLIYQGIEAFFLWTGKRPSYGLVKAAVDRYLREK